MSRSSVVDFCARLCIVDDLIVRSQYWCDQLEQLETDSRSGEEWVQEHIEDTTVIADLRQHLDLPPEGDYQVMFRGELYGYYDDASGEWDERMEVYSDRTFQPIDTLTAARLLENREEMRNYRDLHAPICPKCHYPRPDPLSICSCGT